MKLRNKKTGEIIDIYKGEITLHYNQGRKTIHFKSLEELEEWEDYEEPKDRWYINENGGVLHYIPYSPEGEDLVYNKYQDEIGNHFETKEEAEKAVEKLKAWKRLKDTYFVSFDLDFVKNTISFTYRIDATLHSAVNEERIIFEDMKTIFGGEE